MDRIRAYLLSRKTLGNVVVLAVLGIWYLTFAPTTIGGPAAFIDVQGHSMDGTYLTGDLVITKKQDSYAKGDIVAFKVEGGQVIHRIIGGDGEKGYTLQGDNNPDPDPWHPTDEDVVGKAWIHLPQKAHLLDLPADPEFAGISAGFLTLLVLLWDGRPRRGRAAAHEAAQESDESLVTQLLGDGRLPRQREAGERDAVDQGDVRSDAHV